MVLRIRESFSGCYESAEERIVRVIHLIAAENLPQAVLVKCLVMGYQRQSRGTEKLGILIAEGYQLLNLLPDLREYRSLFSLLSISISGNQLVMTAGPNQGTIPLDNRT